MIFVAPRFVLVIPGVSSVGRMACSTLNTTEVTMGKVMVPYEISEVGLFRKLSDVISTEGAKGDRKTPRPHTMKYFVAKIQPYTQVSWSGYTGEVLEYKNSPSAGLAGIHNDLAACKTADPWFTSNLPDWSCLRNRCFEKVFDELRGNSELLVDLAESGQTLKMLRNAASLKKSMRKFVLEVQKSAKSPKRIPEVAADKWLEYRYGWVPLAHSLWDAADNIGRRIQEAQYTCYARSGWKNTSSSFESFVNGGWPQTVTQQESISARIQVMYKFNPPPLPQQYIQHWTSLNPLPIAWELVPLSVVADWFVNVGDCLRNWENWVLYSQYFAGGVETTSFLKTAAGVRVSGQPAPTKYYWPNGSLMSASGSRTHCSANVRSVYKNRTILTTLPTPSGLRLKINLNAKRVADSAAFTKRFWSRIL